MRFAHYKFGESSVFLLGISVIFPFFHKKRLLFLALGDVRSAHFCESPIIFYEILVIFLLSTRKDLFSLLFLILTKYTFWKISVISYFDFKKRISFPCLLWDLLIINSGNLRYPLGNLGNFSFFPQEKASVPFPWWCSLGSLMRFYYNFLWNFSNFPFVHKKRSLFLLFLILTKYTLWKISVISYFDFKKRIYFPCLLWDLLIINSGNLRFSSWESR